MIRHRIFDLFLRYPGACHHVSVDNQHTLSALREGNAEINAIDGFPLTYKRAGYGNLLTSIAGAHKHQVSPRGLVCFRHRKRASVAYQLPLQYVGRGNILLVDFAT